ncbi:Tvp38p [Nakaseomyces bracarensis]|uniref:Tvp38p n=1 Tax=Nakaseomyces bracarensis TaxID=273131 RepID=UPI003871AABE
MAEEYEARTASTVNEDDFTNNDIDTFPNDPVNSLPNKSIFGGLGIDENDDDDTNYLNLYNMTPRERLLHTIKRTSYRALDHFNSLPKWQRILVVLFGVCVAVLGLLMLIFHKKVLAKVLEMSQDLHERKSTNFVLLILLFFVAFPPMIGYSSLSTITGLIYGVSLHGFIILAIGSVTGSVSSFYVFKNLLHSRAEQLVHMNKRFEALASILQEDNSYLMLALLRLCPFPYSLTNGAIAGIYGISIRNFTIANIITTPKLFIYLFIGSRIKSLAESDSTGSKIFDIVSILVTLLIFTLTAWLLYFKTKQRYQELKNQGVAQQPVAMAEPDFEI